DDAKLSTTERAPGRRATPEMTVVTPDYDDRVGAALKSLGVPRSRDYLGMFKVLDADGLLRVFGRSEIRAEPRGESTMHVRWQNQAADVTEREFVKLVFGPERVADFASAILPVAFFLSPLDRV